MQFEVWEAIYLKILEDFNFSKDRDEEAAKLLSSLIQRSPKNIAENPPNKKNKNNINLKSLSAQIRGNKVLVCGNAPTLESELVDILPKKKSESKKSALLQSGVETVIAADGATTTLLKMGIVPDVIVTDLDGTVHDIIAANEMGAIVVVHAHGDNMDALKKYVPKLTRIVGTTQSKPLSDIHNFGGFTDGDRCVFLAAHFGAAEIKLIGFDYDDEKVTPMKKKKLKWAKLLVEMALAEHGQNR
jgi:uncharacterized Rossmann fold enzyme